LRESPDVVVTGEMRDLETIQVALQAAETGVLVFGTLHTNSASKAADRIIDVISRRIARSDPRRGIGHAARGAGADAVSNGPRARGAWRCWR
jgi:twitching motility protein PilT